MELKHYVWTPEGMTRHFNHPLIVGGVFVRSEDYEALQKKFYELRDERDTNP